MDRRCIDPILHIITRIICTSLIWCVIYTRICMDGSCTWATWLIPCHCKACAFFIKHDNCLSHCQYWISTDTKQRLCNGYENKKNMGILSLNYVLVNLYMFLCWRYPSVTLSNEFPSIPTINIKRPSLSRFYSDFIGVLEYYRYNNCSARLKTKKLNQITHYGCKTDPGNVQTIKTHCTWKTNSELWDLIYRWLGTIEVCNKVTVQLVWNGSSAGKLQQIEQSTQKWL